MTKIGSSHLTREGKRALYFAVLFHIDSCDLGVLFGGDKKGKVTKRPYCNIWGNDSLFTWPSYSGKQLDSGS